MTTSSKSRLQRRQDRKVAANEAPKSIIALTETADGGFTISLGLHGAKMNELYPDKSFPVSIVDVIALAVANIIRTKPADFQAAIEKVGETLRQVNADITEGAPAGAEATEA